MTKPFLVLLCIACAVLGNACDRRDEAQPSPDMQDTQGTVDPNAPSITRSSPTVDPNTPAPTTPPTAAVAPTPGTEADVRQEANAQQADMQANTQAAAAPAEPSSDKDNAARRASSDLGNVGDAKIDATAVLEENAEGVSIVVRVEDATPGPRSVRIYERADCDDLDKKALGAPFNTPKQGKVGTFTVDANGKGMLEMNAPNANLKADDKTSLVGKTIVVQKPSASSDPLACGVIRINAGLADKAGRMTDKSGKPNTAH